MRFLCFGDSLTAGYPGYYPAFDGISRGNGNIQSQYEYWLKNYCLDHIKEKNSLSVEEFEENLLFINKGIPGDTSSGLLYRVDKDLLSLKPKPDYCIIIIGTNDLGWSSSTDHVFENIKKLHEISRENDIISIGGLIPPITRRASDPKWDIVRGDFNEELKKFFNENDIPFTDHRYMTEKDDYLKQEYTSGDGVHFSVAGYKMMGCSLFQNVLKLIIEDFFS